MYSFSELLKHLGYLFISQPKSPKHWRTKTDCWQKLLQEFVQHTHVVCVSYAWCLGPQSTLGQDIFAPKHVLKINRMPKFFVTFARKSPNYTCYLPQKYFFLELFFAGVTVPAPLPPTPMMYSAYDVSALRCVHVCVWSNCTAGCRESTRWCSVCPLSTYLFPSFLHLTFIPHSSPQVGFSTELVVIRAADFND